MLSGCSTTQGPQHPVIINNVCSPPKEIMTVHGDLKKITEKTLTEQQAIDQWLSDTQEYNFLNIEHTALINWINKNCK